MSIIQTKRGTGAAWAAANPVLASGEIGLNTTNGRLKVGDGVTAWNSLTYASGQTADEVVAAINASAEVINDANIAPTIARDTEVASSISAHSSEQNVHHSEVHTILSHDTTVTGAQLNALKAKVDSIEDNAKDDQNASEVPNTPAGNISSTNVQAAINELDTEKETPAGAQSKVNTHAADTSTHGVTTVIGSSEAQSLTNKIINADSNTISNIDNSEIKAAAGIVESKLALDYGTTSLKSSIAALENDIDYPSTVKQKAITDTGENGGVEGGVFNGDFEYGSGSRSTSGWIGDEKYGWYFTLQTANATVEYDNIITHNGTQSLKISLTDVTGRGYVRSSSEFNNTNIRVKPSTKYKLSGYIKSNNVLENSVYIGLQQYDSDGITGSSSNTPPIAAGSSDWTYCEKIITSDADAHVARITLVHTIAGNISDAWFDDIKLEQIDTQAVNTQVATPASVSVEGVTTTDNVDQSQTSGTDNLGSVSTVPNTQGQTFIPTESHHTKLSVYGVNDGSVIGDVTVKIFKWDTDYATTIAGSVLASATVLQANLVDGGMNEFELPCILEVGSTYLYHATGTGAGVGAQYKLRGNTLSNDYADGSAHSESGTVNYDWNFIQYFAKHTESPIIEANGSSLDLTGVKLLTGATITVNADGSGRYAYTNDFSTSHATNIAADIHETTGLYATTQGNIINDHLYTCNNNLTFEHVFKFDTLYPITSLKIIATAATVGTATDHEKIQVSEDNITFVDLLEWDYDAGDTNQTKEAFSDIANGRTTVYINLLGIDGEYVAITDLTVLADLNCQAELPIFAPSSEVTSETSDLVLNPIDISEDGHWELKYDLTGWGSRTITMLSDEATWESQAVSANTIYIYDNNGTSAWTWDERNGLVPPADRTSGVVMAKFLVGDNQIKSSVNSGSMKANFNLAWDEESLRAAINRLTEIANLQYPIVVEVDDVPAIDLQNEPTGASAETGYTNDVTSLRQTAAATPAIAYTGLLPRENRFSEWLDIVVECDDGDGTLQGKLYTMDGTLVQTFDDIGTDGILSISNPDYKYSRERLVLQISASSETTSAAWAVTSIKWHYQYNG